MYLFQDPLMITKGEEGSEVKDEIKIEEGNGAAAASSNGASEQMQVGISIYMSFPMDNPTYIHILTPRIEFELIVHPPPLPPPCSNKGFD